MRCRFRCSPMYCYCWSFQAGSIPWDRGKGDPDFLKTCPDIWVPLLSLSVGWQTLLMMISVLWPRVHATTHRQLRNVLYCVRKGRWPSWWVFSMFLGARVSSSTVVDNSSVDDYSKLIPDGGSYAMCGWWYISTHQSPVSGGEKSFRVG